MVICSSFPACIPERSLLHCLHVCVDLLLVIPAYPHAGTAYAMVIELAQNQKLSENDISPELQEYEWIGSDSSLSLSLIDEGLDTVGIWTASLGAGIIIQPKTIQLFHFHIHPLNPPNVSCSVLSLDPITTDPNHDTSSTPSNLIDTASISRYSTHRIRSS